MSPTGHRSQTEVQVPPGSPCKNQGARQRYGLLSGGHPSSQSPRDLGTQAPLTSSAGPSRGLPPVGSRKRRRHDCARSSPQAHSRSGPGRAAPTWRPQVCPPGPRSASASGPRCVWSVRRLPLRPRHRGKQVSLSLGARHCLGAGCWVAWVPGRRRSGRSSSDRFVFRDLACEPPMIFF